MLIPGSPNWDGHGLSPQNWRDIFFPNPSVQDMCPEKKKKKRRLNSSGLSDFILSDFCINFSQVYLSFSQVFIGLSDLVGGFHHLEKYESQWEG